MSAPPPHVNPFYIEPNVANRHDYYIDEELDLEWTDGADFDSDLDELLEQQVPLSGNEYGSSRRRRRFDQEHNGVRGDGVAIAGARTKCIVLAVIIVLLLVAVSDRGKPGGRYDDYDPSSVPLQGNHTNTSNSSSSDAKNASGVQHNTTNATVDDTHEFERDFTNETSIQPNTKQQEGDEELDSSKGNDRDEDSNSDDEATDESNTTTTTKSSIDTVESTKASSSSPEEDATEVSDMSSSAETSGKDAKTQAKDHGDQTTKHAADETTTSSTTTSSTTTQTTSSSAPSKAHHHHHDDDESGHAKDVPKEQVSDETKVASGDIGSTTTAAPAILKHHHEKANDDDGAAEQKKDHHHHHDDDAKANDSSNGKVVQKHVKPSKEDKDKHHKTDKSKDGDRRARHVASVDENQAFVSPRPADMSSNTRSKL